jgi:RNA polymerase sigma-70 factor, ECF subfamily
MTAVDKLDAENSIPDRHDLYMPSLDHDPQQTERLYRDHSESIYRSAFRLTGRAEDAEDVLQTVFLRFLRRDASLGVIDQPEHYLRRAAVNASLDLLRARKGKVDFETLSNEPASAAQQELRLRLASALASLDPQWAELFVLRFVEGYGNKEIAQMTGQSQTMVGVTLFRARHKLQGELKLQSGSF